MILHIHLASEGETIRYAAEELAHYITMMDSRIQPQIQNAENAECTVTLSVTPHDHIDPALDDVIDVEIENCNGFICGSNPRSVLMGVYEYLKSAGCMWVRPGTDGEHIPKADLLTHSFHFHHQAENRFRGECIEGSISFENVRDTVLWLPKVRMNLFMMEQVVPYNYMSRWYKHTGSKYKAPEDTTFEQIAEYTAQLELLIRKCGLQLHALGHGYLFEPYGIHYHSYGDKYDLSDEARADTALVGGKRELRSGSPNFTQLCMSRPEVRRKQVDWLCQYLIRKPHIDFLHVWLSDAANNHCECTECQKKRPSDFYVMLLNELDEALTAHNIDTRIVFIMYTDTLWPPETETLHNPARFIMTSAPTRDYNLPYDARRYSKSLPPYLRNQYSVPADFSLLLSFCDAWKRAFDGPKFLFEYYFYTDHYFDPGHMSLVQHIAADVRSLPATGFDGIMSDQTQRAAFPTALPLALLGELLFDSKLDETSYAESYFAAAYGTGAESAHRYLTAITTAFQPEQLRSPDSVVMQDTGTGNRITAAPIQNNAETAARLRTVASITDSFAEKAQTYLAEADSACHRLSWQLLCRHGEFCRRYAEILLPLAESDDKATARARLSEMQDWLYQIEDEMQPQFDPLLFCQRVRQIIDK